MHHPAVHAVHVVAVITVMHPHLARAAMMAHWQLARHARHLSRIAVRAIRAATAALLARKPRISVVTPTWQRRDLLLGRCIPSIRAQDYDGEIEHVIVSDGPDEALAGIPGIAFLGRHRTELNKGVTARATGTAMATGELIAYLDDDNSWRPDHLSLLADAIEREDVSFAYSRAACSNANGCRWEVGCAPPVFGQIDTSLIVHRAGLLETAQWEPSWRPADWHLVDRWLAAGARWAHVPRITLDYFSSVPGLTGRELEEFRRSYPGATGMPALGEFLQPVRAKQGSRGVTCS